MNYEELLNLYNSILEEKEKLLKENLELKQKLLIYENSNIFKDFYENTVVSQKEDIITIKDSENEYSTINSKSKSSEKIKLFLSLFSGRLDVCAKRWENTPTGKNGYSPYCLNEWVQGKCLKPKNKCTNCKYQNFVAFDSRSIKNHLLGKVVLGVYPIDEEDKTLFLVIDFDKGTWKEDVLVVSQICEKYEVQCYIERSRSGNRGIVLLYQMWINLLKKGEIQSY